MNTQQQRKVNKSSPITRSLLIVLLVLALAAAIFIPFAILRNTMFAQVAGSSTGSQAQSSNFSPGSSTKFVCKVVSQSTGNLLRGSILAQNGDSSFSPTGRDIAIQWNPNQPVIMGSSKDVHPGAILQVSGQVDDKGIVRANNVVILTNAVQVH